jgi:hypothetical protein
MFSSVNKALKTFVFPIVLQLLNSHVERSIELARIEAVRRLLYGAEKLRIGSRFLVLTLIMSSMIGAGVVMCVIGGSLLVVWKLMYQENPPLYDLLLWVPLGICVGGLISVIVPFIFIFFYLLSERNWMRILRKNKLFGNFIEEVLEEAKIRPGS